MNLSKFYILMVFNILSSFLCASDGHGDLVKKLLNNHDNCVLVCIYDSSVEKKDGQMSRLRRRCTITAVLKGDLKVSRKIDIYTYFEPGVKLEVKEGEMRFLFFDKQKSYVNGVELETGRGFLYSDELLKGLSEL